ncbi:MAG: MFS transporter [Desulfobacterales bacterium]|nr:MFS transporter [Desulfobacterales bacterium]
MDNSNSEGKWYRDYRWIIVIIMLFASIINYLDRVNLSIANTTISKDFGLDPIHMGFLLSAFMWPYSIANLPAGWLIDKIGINLVFLWSALLWSIITIAGGYAQGFLSMYILRVFLGIVEAPFFICAGKFTQLHFEEKLRGTSSSIINMGPKIANGFAPPLLTFMMLYFGWRNMFIILGLSGIIIVVLWLKFYKDDAIVINQTSTNEYHQKSYLLALFKLPVVWWFNLGNIGSSYMFWLYFTWLPTYLVQKREMSISQAGWASAIPFIAGVIAVPVGGWISDYFIRKGMDVIKARMIPTVGGCFLAAAAVIPVNYINDNSIAIMLISISLFAGALRVGVLWALVGDLSPREAVGSLGGIQNFASFIGGALAPICTGYILQTTSSYNLVFILSGILCLIGAFSYMMINKKITLDDINKVSISVNSDFTVKRLHKTIISDVKKKLGRSLKNYEKEFITSRSGFIALEMIHNTIKTAEKDEIESYLSSELNHKK